MPLESLETVALPAEQSRDDNHAATAVCSSTSLNLLPDGNMIARRVLRDRSTSRNTIGTYEYNPVNERAEGWRRRGPVERACGVDAARVSHPHQIRRVPSAKIRGRRL